MRRRSFLLSPLLMANLPSVKALVFDVFGTVVDWRGTIIREGAELGKAKRIEVDWAKSHSFATGQCPVMRYHRQLMQAILYDKIQIAKAVNVTVISLDGAPDGYKDFDQGAAKKLVLDPHNVLGSAA